MGKNKKLQNLRMNLWAKVVMANVNSGIPSKIAVKYANGLLDDFDEKFEDETGNIEWGNPYPNFPKHEVSLEGVAITSECSIVYNSDDPNHDGVKC